MSGLPYIPGSSFKKSFPLSRFLPPLPEGVASTWLKNQFSDIPADSRPWILDPFGVSPHTDVEIARSGFRILVTANNPILRFYIELLAQPISENVFLSTLAELSSSHKGDERIEPLIRSLYTTECDKCNAPIQVQAFLWDRGAASPFGRIYACPHCGDSGEKLATPADFDHVKPFTSGGLHRARALERITSLNDPDRQYAEEALDTYLPRTIYVLLTLVNKLDGFSEHRRALSALLLSVFDQSTSLWPHPTQRARPKLLTVPTHFRENNIWQALVNAVEQWMPDPGSNPIPVTFWPEQPPQSGGICIFEGRLRDLVDSVVSLNNTTSGEKSTPVFGAMVTTIPRPNQAFWTLSALWTGWLWGKAAAAPFKSVLRRRRYDWQWLYHALSSAFSISKSILPTGMPALLLMGEAESGFLFSTCLSLTLAGYTIKNISLREEIGEVQIQCQSPDESTAIDEASIPSLSAVTQDIQTAIQNMFKERNEPVSYLHILSSAFMKVNQHKQCIARTDQASSDIYSQISTIFTRVFSTSEMYIRFNKSEYSLDVGRWWFEKPDQDILNVEVEKYVDLSLSDRIEIMVVNFLLKNPGTSFENLDENACKSFPGSLTPERSLVSACLDSYANQEQASSTWFLRKEDHPESRRSDLERVKNQVSQLGEKLGYSIDIGEENRLTKRSPIVWMNKDGNPAYVFYCQASAIISTIVFRNEYPGEISILVVPGGRSGLLDYKINHDPRLSQVIESGWRFLKFRHLNHLTDNESIATENFSSFLDLDTITKADSQILLL